MNICIFGAASNDIAVEYKDAAFELGALIAAGGCYCLSLLTVNKIIRYYERCH